MRRSNFRRTSSKFNGKRRIVAAAATLVAFGAVVTVSQVSDASTKRRALDSALAACSKVKAPQVNTKLWSTETKRGTYTTDDGTVTQHADDGGQDVPSTETLQARCKDKASKKKDNKDNKGKDKGGKETDNKDKDAKDKDGKDKEAKDKDAKDKDGKDKDKGKKALDILANSCDGSKLTAHDGFQKGNRCVSTQFGEVGTAANNASLLITKSPANVNVNQAFTLSVSTRNLIRDRFLAAGDGGYYVESSLLKNGIVRGHFHTACRLLESQNTAPDPAPAPAFFVATEDGKGGAKADTVNVQVAGLPKAGTAQCAVWAGDGSHRIPMMERANQTPAFDVVRVQVNGGGGGGGNKGNGGGGDKGNGGGGDKGDGGGGKKGGEGGGGKRGK